MPSFREPPWASALLTSTVKRKELSICWQFVVFYVEDPCLSIAFAFTAVMVASHAMQRLSSISVASFTAATTAIAGAPSASTDWIIWSFHLCQTLPAVCPLVAFRGTTTVPTI